MSSPPPRSPDVTGPGSDHTVDLHRLLVESVADYAIFALDPTGVVLNWNTGAQRIKGFTRDEIVGRYFGTFFPAEEADAGRPARLLATAAREGRVEDEGWRVRKDGTRFWANVVITALHDPSGALVGYAKVTRDLTARRASDEQARHLAAEEAARAESERQRTELEIANHRLQEQAVELEAQTEEAQALAEELEHTNTQLEEAERFATGVLASIDTPFVVYDDGWHFRYINTRAEQLLDASTGERLLGRVVWNVFPHIVGTPTHVAMTRAMAERRPVLEEVRNVARGTWTEIHCSPLPNGWLATSWRDVSERKHAEEATHFLSRATAIVGSSLDYEATLASVARLLVPQLADWCAVDVVGEDGAIRRLAVAHVDPAKVRLAQELEERYPPDPNTGVPEVIRTGAPQFYPEIPAALLEGSARDAEHLRFVRELGLRSAIVVPLAAGTRVMGALTLVSAESGRRYTAGDLALAEEIARRSATAVEHARLHRAALAAREAAEAAADEAARANAAKSEFLTIMSHELRTPLNAIAGYAELLELGIHGPVTDAQREALGRIRGSQRHLLSLINDVLNFAKLAAGHVDVAAAAFPVAPLVAGLEALVGPQLRAKRLAYAAHVDDASLTAHADQAKVTQILLNLLSNAIKFTEPGGRIDVDASSADDAVVVRVRDTGVGIASDQLERVFEPFVQITRELSSGHEGTGLGLAISRDLARVMGGELVAESEVGRGSTFTLRLPVG